MKRIIERDVHVCGKIEKLYKGCPKADGWFGGVVNTSEYGRMRITGVCHEQVAVRMKIEVVGNIIENDYGEQLEAKQVKVCLDDNRTLQRYLAGASFKGIGAVTADKLVSAFGANLFEAVRTQPQYVQARCGLNDEQLSSLEKGLAFFSLENHLVTNYPHLGATYIHDIAVNHRFEHVSLRTMDELLHRNPYILLDKCPNIPFSVVDNVALLDVKVPWNFEKRIEIIFVKTLEQMLISRGFTYINVSDVAQMEEFRYNFNKMAKAQVDASFIAYWMNVLTTKNQVSLELFLDELHLYSTRMHSFEDMIFRIVSHKTLPMTSKVYSQHDWIRVKNNMRTYGVSDTGLFLSKEQEQCIEHVLNHSLSCVAGGPGRGKTFLLRALVQTWRYCVDGAVLLLAPTGKAVNRLKTCSDLDNVETVARFLYHNAGRAEEDGLIDVFGHGFVDCPETLVIVDEASMLCYADGARLLEKFRESHVVFVGDKNQLPPVEPGPFFYSLLESGLVSCFELTENHRSKSKEIGTNADIMLSGKMSFQYTNHFKVLPCLDNMMVNFVLNMYQTYLQNGCEPSDVLLLSPINKGVGSVRDVNGRLQDLVNRKFQGSPKVLTTNGRRYIDQKGYEIPEFVFHDENGVRHVRIFDRVMNMKNHMDVHWKKYAHNDMSDKVVDKGDGCFNGDMGMVIRYYPETYETPASVAVLLDDGRVVIVEVTDFKEWSLAYCITIHKSQGSECSKCLVLLPENLSKNPWFLQSNFLNRNLLYTGITRAQDDVCLIGNMDVFRHCVEHDYKYRNTVLHTKLQSVALQRQMRQIQRGDDADE